MNLTSEQVAAAEAAGCRFIPVPPEGLHRYAMQRKLFRLDGQEMLATCGGGLYETASTLDRLIAIGRDRLPAAAALPVADPPAPPLATLPEAPAVEAQPTPAPTEESAPTQQVAEAADAPEAATPSAPRRRTRTPRAPAPVAEEGVVPDAVATSDTTPRPGSRARKPAGAARWATAGAERRGRIDQHWSKRGR